MKKRVADLRPLFEDFYAWLATVNPVAKSKLAIAVQYIEKLRNGYEKVFEDGRLELTNNRVERHIKKLVMGRKNWLHSTSLEGARASGIILSVYKTAELNELDPVKSLEFLFDKIPNLPCISDEALDQLLPWQKSVSEALRAY